jgi:hypothetical protein
VSWRCAYKLSRLQLGQARRGLGEEGEVAAEDTLLVVRLLALEVEEVMVSTARMVIFEYLRGPQESSGWCVEIQSDVFD